MVRASAVIVAAGQGTRLGAGLPKAFVPLGGRPLLTYSLETLASHGGISDVVLVVPAERIEECRHLAALHAPGAAVLVVAGGDHRWQSVATGLNATGANSEIVLVHDAARPFLSTRVIDALLEKARTYACVITATEVVDTIRTFAGDLAGQTVDRSTLIRVGTPQLFRRADLLRGLQLASTMAQPPTDEAVLMQSMGMAVGIAAGDPLNFKITSQGDLELAEAIIAARSKGSGCGRAT